MNALKMGYDLTSNSINMFRYGCRTGKHVMRTWPTRWPGHGPISLYSSSVQSAFFCIRIRIRYL